MNQPTDVSSVEPDIDLARSLFAELETTREGRGFTPATYGQGVTTDDELLLLGQLYFDPRAPASARLVK